MDRIVISPVAQHYGSQGLFERIKEAVKAAGIDWGRLSIRDLAPLDQLHIRGLEATQELADLAGFKAGMKILDVGCGIGGPARWLAAERRCSVQGVDITKDFIDTAQKLATATYNTAKFDCCNALQLPYRDESFDGAWTQHVTMNIKDKFGLFESVWRVLKPGGTYAFHEIVRPEGSLLHYPVPWATTAEASFPATEGEFKKDLAGVGLSVTEWKDVTDECRDWIQAGFDRKEKPALTPYVVVGPKFGEMIRNVHRNLAEGRAQVVMGLAKK
ncbi:MAG TPA: class I SAM-dependent methyltransferase [Fimbriimonadaceae bacterium]|nr:class I SAM-dependent methyltransferase [Fimbriimonadaceae bacterium]